MMNETAKHTPGPWVFCPTDFKIYRQHVNPSAVPYGAAAHKPVIGQSRAFEDGELFAAAPDLLAACKAILGEDNPPAGESGHIDLSLACDMARAAIAKAEGK